MRTLIAKHLQTRSKTIQTALAKYNRAAKSLKKKELTFDRILDVQFLEDFDLLRDCREEVREKPWAQSGNRIMREAFFKVRRANEEIERLNVEILRVYLWAQQELNLYATKYIELMKLNPALGHALGGYRQQMDLMHTEIFLWLGRCMRLPGYRGGQYSRPTATAVHDKDEASASDSDSDGLDSLIDGAEASLLRLELLG
jgi:hypothetical protein